MKKDARKPFVENIVQSSMENVLHNAMIPYAEHVILERALPRVEDGLKPVQRRILFTMRELANTPDKPHRKCARIVGDCLGKYHPHGDSSVYDALVRMAQPFSLRAPLVDGHGNFGSIDGDSAAAMRYTEARMTPLALQMLRDIDKDTVPFRLNFDDTQREPDMLPARFPNLLVNGASGIAVGLATNVPPHNLGEAIDAVIAQMNDPDIPLLDLMRILPAPDFPTGGVLLDNDEIRQGYETGRSKLTLRARVHVEDGASGRKLLVITEVPYQVSKAAMLEKILRLSEEKKAALGAIYDIRDESDRTGLRAVVELRREADPERVLAYLYKYSDLQVTFGVNMVAIAGGKPEQMGLKALIGHFIRYQKEVVTRRTQYDLDHAKARAHVLEGLMVAVDNLDEVIALIRASKAVKDAREGLMKRFSLSEAQAQAILDLRLQRLTNLEILALRKEYEALLRLIAELEGVLKSERKLLNVIRRELAEVRAAFADARRTTLVSAERDTVPEITEERVAEEATVVFTRGGQLRRLQPKIWQKLCQPAPGAEPPPPEAAPRWVFQTDTDRTLYFFTNAGNCYTLSVGALPEMNRPRDRGTALTGVLAGLEKDETLAALFCLTDEELRASPDFLFVTRQGVVKRTRAAEYCVRRQKFAAMNVKPGDAVLTALPCPAEDTLLLVTEKGMCIRFSLSEVNAQGRVAGGVRGMTLSPGDFVTVAAPLRAGMEALVASERGSLKRVPEMDFDAQSRGGKGVRIIYFNKNGSTGTRVVAALTYAPAPGLAVRVTQAKSAPTTLPVADVAIQGKQGKGVACVMAVMDDVVTGVELVGEGGA